MCGLINSGRLSFLLKLSGIAHILPCTNIETRPCERGLFLLSHSLLIPVVCRNHRANRSQHPGTACVGEATELHVRATSKGRGLHAHLLDSTQLSLSVSMATKGSNCSIRLGWLTHLHQGSREILSHGCGVSVPVWGSWWRDSNLSKPFFQSNNNLY